MFKLSDTLKLGVIGCGLRCAKDLLPTILKFGLGVEIAAVCDLDAEGAKTRLHTYGVEISQTRFYADADIMLDKEKLDGVIVATRCSLHASMAMKVMERRIPLFLEKPVATNMEDLAALRRANDHSTVPVAVSLPLRVTHLAKLAKELIDTGTIGQVEHVQAYNNVTYGDAYYHCWYRDEEETQGLFIQKAVHDFDYINHLLGRTPRMVAAMKSKRVFTGDHPAGLRCADCAERETCPQGPFVAKFLRGQPVYEEAKCCFAVDTGNEDSSSALVLYDTGMHTAYSQNFFCRNAAGKRGARFFGYKGTLEFDWYTNVLTVYDHNTDRVTTHRFSSQTEGHGGGDASLMLNFIRVMQGREEPCAPLAEALEANLLCLKARQSSETLHFEPVSYDPSL